MGDLIQKEKQELLGGAINQSAQWAFKHNAYLQNYNRNRAQILDARANELRNQEVVAEQQLPFNLFKRPRAFKWRDNGFGSSQMQYVNGINDRNAARLYQRQAELKQAAPIAERQRAQAEREALAQLKAHKRSPLDDLRSSYRVLNPVFAVGHDEKANALPTAREHEPEWAARNYGPTEHGPGFYDTSGIFSRGLAPGIMGQDVYRQKPASHPGIVGQYYPGGPNAPVGVYRPAAPAGAVGPAGPMLDQLGLPPFPFQDLDEQEVRELFREGKRGQRLGPGPAPRDRRESNAILAAEALRRMYPQLSPPPSQPEPPLYPIIAPQAHIGLDQPPGPHYENHLPGVGQQGQLVRENRAADSVDQLERFAVNAPLIERAAIQGDLKEYKSEYDNKVAPAAIPALGHLIARNQPRDLSTNVSSDDLEEKFHSSRSRPPSPDAMDRVIGGPGGPGAPPVPPPPPSWGENKYSANQERDDIIRGLIEHNPALDIPPAPGPSPAPFIPFQGRAQHIDEKDDPSFWQNRRQDLADYGQAGLELAGEAGRAGLWGLENLGRAGLAIGNMLSPVGLDADQQARLAVYRAAELEEKRQRAQELASRYAPPGPQEEKELKREEKQLEHKVRPSPADLDRLAEVKGVLDAAAAPAGISPADLIAQRGRLRHGLTPPASRRESAAFAEPDDRLRQHLHRLNQQVRADSDDEQEFEDEPDPAPAVPVLVHRRVQPDRAARHRRQPGGYNPRINGRGRKRRRGGTDWGRVGDLFMEKWNNYKKTGRGRSGGTDWARAKQIWDSKVWGKGRGGSTYLHGRLIPTEGWGGPVTAEGRQMIANDKWQRQLAEKAGYRGKGRGGSTYLHGRLIPTEGWGGPVTAEGRQMIANDKWQRQLAEKAGYRVGRGGNWGSDVDYVPQYYKGTNVQRYGRGFDWDQELQPKKKHCGEKRELVGGGLGTALGSSAASNQRYASSVNVWEPNEGVWFDPHPATGPQGTGCTPWRRTNGGFGADPGFQFQGIDPNWQFPKGSWDGINVRYAAGWKGPYGYTTKIEPKMMGRIECARQARVQNMAAIQGPMGAGFTAGMREPQVRHFGNQTSRWKGGVPDTFNPGLMVAGSSPAFVSVPHYPWNRLDLDREKWLAGATASMNRRHVLSTGSGQIRGGDSSLHIGYADTGPFRAVAEPRIVQQRTPLTPGMRPFSVGILHGGMRDRSGYSKAKMVTF